MGDGLITPNHALERTRRQVPSRWRAAVAAGRSASTLGLNLTHLMLPLVPPVSDSRRACVVPVARRAPSASVSVRCVLPVAVKPAASALDRTSGASRGKRRGRCARRACALAWQAMERSRRFVWASVAGRAAYGRGAARARSVVVRTSRSPPHTGLTERSTGPPSARLRRPRRPVTLHVRLHSVLSRRLLLGVAILAPAAALLFHWAVDLRARQSEEAQFAVQSAARDLDLDLTQFVGPDASGAIFAGRVFHWRRGSKDGIDLLAFLADEQLVCWSTISPSGVLHQHGCVAARTGA
jgi:hypothetical protein